MRGPTWVSGSWIRKPALYGVHADAGEGLSHHPEDEQLLICLAVSQMNLGRFPEALAILRRCPSHPSAQRLAAACRKATGRS